MTSSNIHSINGIKEFISINNWKKVQGFFFPAEQK